jgi:cytochrome c
MRIHLATTVAGLLLSAAIAGGAHAETAATGEADAGAKIAQRWCVNCHVIGPAQKTPVPQGPPTFMTIAQSGMSTDQLHAFLSHPHGAMPDLSLTRAEIDDLIAYIHSLR